MAFTRFIEVRFDLFCFFRAVGTPVPTIGRFLGLQKWGLFVPIVSGRRGRRPLQFSAVPRWIGAELCYTVYYGGKKKPIFSTLPTLSASLPKIRFFFLFRLKGFRRLRTAGVSLSAESDKGYAPLTAPPFEKGGRKLDTLALLSVFVKTPRRSAV